MASGPAVCLHLFGLLTLLVFSLCLSRRIGYCQTADEFYSTMGCLTQEMLEHKLIDSTELMQVQDLWNTNLAF